VDTANEPLRRVPARSVIKQGRAAALAAALLAVAELSVAAEAPVSFAEAGASIQTHTLANGLQVIVWPDHRIPSVTLFNWVHVGSRNEGSGTTGLAHFFEHMMFNGTAHRSQGEFDRLLEGNGGSNNAYTSQDVTVYQDSFPRSALELVFNLESDRLASLAFDPRVVESEREVVYSERRLRVEDNNPAFLSEQVQATAFIAHPYRIPTIGWPSDIKAWTLADLQNFYHTWYAPNNCTLVVVGDVEPEQVFALAEKYYGPIARGPPTLPVRTVEPEQTGERRVEIERRAQNPLLQVAWHGISADDPRAPALNLLQTILTEGDASRLNRVLVEDRKLAVDVGSGWPEGFDPSIYSVYATLAEGASTAELEKALNAEIARLVESGVTPAELARAKNQVAALFWRGVSTLDGRAQLLGEYAVLHGDYHKLFAAPAAYERVTAAQVLAVARDVFKAKQRTVGVLRPRAAAEH
jgi:zinc protease